jgi:hypothetical protein
MTAIESMNYLYAKLRASGRPRPDKLMSIEICDELYRASGGWPGALDELALIAMERSGGLEIQLEHIHPSADFIGPANQTTDAAAADTPAPAVEVDGDTSGEPTPSVESSIVNAENEAVIPDAASRAPHVSVVSEVSEPGIQKLFVTLNGKTLQEFELKEAKTLIGRAKFCDLCINNRYISKFHAILIRGDDVLYLVDLKSQNGTFVNSHRVQIATLRHDDIISLGNHGIKLVSPTSRTRTKTPESDLVDTATLKTLADIRRLKASAKGPSLPDAMPNNKT